MKIKKTSANSGLPQLREMCTSDDSLSQEIYIFTENK
jgi:general stress protein 26